MTWGSLGTRVLTHPHLFTCQTAHFLWQGPSTQSLKFANPIGVTPWVKPEALYHSFLKQMEVARRNCHINWGWLVFTLFASCRYRMIVCVEPFMFRTTTVFGGYWLEKWSMQTLPTIGHQTSWWKPAINSSTYFKAIKFNTYFRVPNQKKGPPTDASYQRGEQLWCQCLNAKIRCPEKDLESRWMCTKELSVVTFPKTCVYIYTYNIIHAHMVTYVYLLYIPYRCNMMYTYLGMYMAGVDLFCKRVN